MFARYVEIRPTIEKVAKKTLDRVNQAIASTGYVPNLLAGGLASNRSHLVAAIVPSIINLVYVETIQAFSNKLRDSGYQVLLGESGYGQETEETLEFGQRERAD